eukprot:365810-Chlamydomonas_euryale.AAC.19
MHTQRIDRLRLLIVLHAGRDSRCCVPGHTTVSCATGKLVRQAAVLPPPMIWGLPVDLECNGAVQDVKRSCRLNIWPEIPNVLISKADTAQPKLYRGGQVRVTGSGPTKDTSALSAVPVRWGQVI